MWQRSTGIIRSDGNYSNFQWVYIDQSENVWPSVSVLCIHLSPHIHKEVVKSFLNSYGFFFLSFFSSWTLKLKTQQCAVALGFILLFQRKDSTCQSSPHWFRIKDKTRNTASPGWSVFSFSSWSYNSFSSLLFCFPGCSLWLACV